VPAKKTILWNRAGAGRNTDGRFSRKNIVRETGLA
jgi:hypothetical protein